MVPVTLPAIGAVMVTLTVPPSFAGATVTVTEPTSPTES
jgi:hypothetical protein